MAVNLGDSKSGQSPLVVELRRSKRENRTIKQGSTRAARSTLDKEI